MKNTKTSILLFVLLSIFISTEAKSQCFVDNLENIRLEKFNKDKMGLNYADYEGMVINGTNELRTVLQLINRDFNTDLYTKDTVYMIIGHDIESGQSNGRIWNQHSDFRYERTFNVENYVIKNDTIIVQIFDNNLSKNEYQILDQFDGLIKLIEEKDTTALYKIQKDNSVLSGWYYNITTIEKAIDEYQISEFTLDDFWINKNE
jgi:hypothetical protein